MKAAKCKDSKINYKIGGLELEVRESGGNGKTVKSESVSIFKKLQIMNRQTSIFKIHKPIDLIEESRHPTPLLKVECDQRVYIR